MISQKGRIFEHIRLCLLKFRLSAAVSLRSTRNIRAKLVTAHENPTLDKLIITCDKKIERLSVKAHKRAKRLYERTEYNDALRAFNELKPYKDSAEMAQKCLRLENEKRALIESESAAVKAVKSAKAELIMQNRRERRKALRKKFVRKALIISCHLAIFLTVALMCTASKFAFDEYIFPKFRYIGADNLFKRGHYAEAFERFKALGNYSDAYDKSMQAKYENALKLLSDGEYDAAIDLFGTMKYYGESRDRMKEAYYRKGEQYLAAGEYDNAIAAFRKAAKYSDYLERIHEANYLKGLVLMESGSYEDAIEAFKSAMTYSDAPDRLLAARLEWANGLILENDLRGAYNALKAGAANAEVKEALKQVGLALYESGDYVIAARCLDSAGYRESEYEIAKQTARLINENLQVGNYVTFGSYEQDGDETNGAEPIEWLILSKNSFGDCILISRYVLDAAKYNDKYAYVTWEDCTLRKWLNEDFYNAAFTSSEQSYILTTTVMPYKSPYYPQDPGNHTLDKVYILSPDEISNLGLYPNTPGIPTSYALSRGVTLQESIEPDMETCIWWMRSNGIDLSYAAAVVDGFLNLAGYDVYKKFIGVRPVICVRGFERM